MNALHACLRCLTWTACAAALAGCAAAPAAAPELQAKDSLQESLGIAVRGLHLSAHDAILDLRYRVTDPAKAAVLLDPKKKVQLLDPKRDAALGVPESPIIGPMRQTSRNRVVYRDRDYFVLFVNPGKAVRAGETVQLAVDGRPLASLRVE